MRLQTKLLLTLLPLLTLTILGLGWWLYQQEQQDKYKDAYTILDLLLDDLLQDHVQPLYLQQQSRGSGAGADNPDYRQHAQTLLESYPRRVPRVELFIFASTGRVLASLPDQAHAAPELQHAIQQAVRQADTAQHGDTGKIIYTARYFAPWDWVIILGEDETHVMAALEPVRIAMLSAALLCALLTTVLVWLLFRQFLLRPIRILQQAATGIATRSPIHLIPIRGHDELGALARDMETASQAIVNYIAQRDKAEADLMVRNRALEASVNGVVMCDALQADHPVIYVNPAFERMTGYSAQDMIGQNCRFLQGDDRNQAAIEQVSNALQQHRSVSVELRNYRKDGTLFWNELRVAPIRDESGAVTHFVGIQTDITERKKNEQVLQQSHQMLEQRVAARTAELATANERLRRENTERRRAEQMFRQFIDAAPDATVIVDRQGIIQLVNDQAELLFGYQRDELINQPIEQLLPARFAAQHQRQHEAYFRQPRFRAMGQNRALFGRKKSAVEFPIEVSLSPIETLDGMRVAAAVRDVTERTQAEEALRKAKSEAERVNQAKTRFLAAASHDLRQPLQTISLLSGTLDMKLAEPSLNAIVKKQQTAIQAMQKLLGALLDISRLEAGVIQPAVTPFPVSELLQRLADNYAASAEKQGLQLHIVPCSRVICSDRILLGQIVENLLSNALKYTTAGKVLVGCRRQGGQLCIEVWDTGPGIVQEQQEVIFEEFYQSDNPARDHSKGFGLGLAIVQRLAQLLRHPVSLRSNLGKGSCFSVLVPLVPLAQASRTDHTKTPVNAEVTTSAGRRSMQLLLIEDDPSVLQATQLLLETGGYQVISAANSEQALAALDNGIPALIISDYRLPGNCNGLELIRQIRETVARHLPAILMTGDMSVHKLRTAEASNCRVLHKPIEAQELLTLIHNMLA